MSLARMAVLSCAEATAGLADKLYSMEEAQRVIDLEWQTHKQQQLARCLNCSLLELNLGQEFTKP
ncbi:MAG: hypothetical protein HC767_11065 [Akkermansiaceae bacterium]|nr:hypothetical protein [Akkermansiaceae bacterium]